ncbi:uncharacterized protein LOC132702847 [Cylas formicarius]|uniref:uncharacterized protein LOC132702847 n=1 Tax=Cylas formicarius TaxID=197179 RepID=UPI0029584265|nr:uncharacterized protein LOC132702847 [Cylas formicarius]
MTIIMGDLNAKIGRGKCGELIGGFSLGSRNECGDRLKLFGEEEYTFSVADIESDHSLLAGIFRIKLKTVQKKTVRKQWDMRRLKEEETRKRVTNVLTEKFKQLEEVDNTEEWLQKMSDSFGDIGNEHLVANREKKKSCMTDYILQLMEDRRKAKNNDARDVSCDVSACFIDYQKAFDNVQHNKLIEILKEIGLGEKDLRIIANLYWQQTASVRIEGEESKDTLTERGVCQGCVLSPLLFNVYLERIFHEALEDTNNIRYADDTVVFANNLESLQEMMVRVVQLILQGNVEGRRRPGRRRMLKNLRTWFNTTTVGLFRAAVDKVRIAMMIANIRNA